ncbi:ATPase [Methanolacinia petrolearia DSM 11571]|uniref:ATPase n=1 Tax=Methanolacinia petrolearia (strain DSM 11571 / OCM 486 / SEBR 4847) TaxID=679926 RepID=E1REW9_METP4|nr:ATP-binding protein [Methanolacinia petrolearia]ADN36140.1 ATPase [Methanolacinia petrolearia DSM 11571]
MIQPFVNREQELDFLNKKYAENSAQMIVLYGKRRIGKTELIKKFIEDKDGTYILCTNDSTEENIKEMKDKFADLTGKEYFRDIDVSSFYSLYKHFSEEIGNRNAVIAIDEFPYLIELNRGVVSVFQKIWDELLIDRNLFLIICGSSMGMMETEVLGYKSPLYGRRTGEWNVSPMSFKHLKYFYPVYEKSDLFCLWAICGGIPFYLQKLDGSLTVEENIKKKILRKGEVLYNEPGVLLREEFREPKTYTLILKYLSLGYNKQGELSSVTGIEKGNLSKYLSVLENLRFIEYILPLGRKKGGIYEINDQFFRFWFRFVYPNLSDLEMGLIDEVYSRISPQLNAYYGKQFERLVIEQIKTKEVPLPFTFTDVRPWWHKENEIDAVVTNPENRDILFVECKWKNLDKIDAGRILSGLEKKSGSVQWNNESRKEHFALFAKKVEEKETLREMGYIVFDLDDI